MINLLQTTYRLALTFNPVHFALLNPLSPIRQWLNRLEIRNPTLAHLICRVVPVQCPFARRICLFGHTLVDIPPLCKLNPLYEEIVSLRFRALCYLADDCKADVRCYC